MLDPSSRRQVRIRYYIVISCPSSVELFRMRARRNERNALTTIVFAGQDTSSRRDSNPFSFKAFLKNGTQQTNYHNTGARPKVYSSPTSSPGSVFDKDNAGGVYSSRNPTELPDFVQDHLVIEQCYLNHEAAQPVLPDVDNLPDFALNSVEQRQSRLRNETKKNESEIFGEDLRSFDLTDTLHKGSTHRDHSASNAMHSNHLDLPVFGDRLDESTPYLPRSEHGGSTARCTYIHATHISYFTFYSCKVHEDDSYFLRRVSV